MKKKVLTAVLTSTMAFGFAFGGGVPLKEIVKPERGTVYKLVPTKPVKGIPLPTDPTIRYR